MIRYQYAITATKKFNHITDKKMTVDSMRELGEQIQKDYPGLEITGCKYEGPVDMEGTGNDLCDSQQDQIP